MMSEDYGFWQGAEKATGNIAATGMKLLEFSARQKENEARLGMENKRLGMEQDRADREKIAFGHAERVRAEKEVRDKAFAPASLVAPGLLENPETQKLYKDALQQAGYTIQETPDGNFHTSNAGWEYVKQLHSQNKDFQKYVVDGGITDLQTKSIGLSKKIAEIKASGKEDKTLPILEKQKLALDQQLSDAFTIKDGFQKEKSHKFKMEEERAKKEEERKTKEMTEAGLNSRQESANASRERAAKSKPGKDPETEALNKENKVEILANRTLRRQYGDLPKVGIGGGTEYPTNPQTGNPFTPQEWATVSQKAYDEVSGGKQKGVGVKATYTQTATNAKGEQVGWDGKQWVKIK
jgi:hypothetical protein